MHREKDTKRHREKNRAREKEEGGRKTFTDREKRSEEGVNTERERERTHK